LSGGAGGIDPYYQRDPPRASRGENTRATAKQPKGTVEPTKVETRTDGRRLYYYRCEHCGIEFSTPKPRHNEHAFHSRECCFEWQKYGRPPLTITDQQREASRKRTTALWTKPGFREKTLAGLRKATGRPEYHEKLRASAKEVASRPEWKEKQSRAHTGKKKSPEVGIKVSKAKMGHPVSLETRDKLAAIFRGEGSYFYKDGRSSDRQKFYRSSHWRSQCARIEKRDEGVCQGCGWNEKEARSLSGHHIEPLSVTKYDPHDYPDELVVTLCKPCHSKSELGTGNYKYPLNARGDKAKPERISLTKPWIDFLKKRDGHTDAGDI